MSTYINYLVEASLGLLFFYGMYWLFLRKETNFRFKRVYLIGSLVLSMLFPFIKIGEPNQIIPSIGQALPVYFLPEVVIGDAPQQVTVHAVPAIGGWQLIAWVYVAGMAFAGALLLYQFIRMYRVINRAPVRTQPTRYKIIETSQRIPACSFFNYIILGAADTLSEEDKEQIIRHEVVHAQKYHSLDIVLIELIRLVLWFNPVIHLFKKALSDIHEFQADEKAVKDQDVQTYCSLLARITLQSAGFSLANHFNRSITLKRIKMMKTMKRKMKKWKIAILVPVATALFIAIACQEQMMDDLNAVVENSSAALNIPPSIQAKYEALQKANPEANYIVMELNEEGMKKLDEMKRTYGLPKLVQVFTIGEENYEKTGDPSFTGTSEAGIMLRHTEKDDPRQSFAIIEYNSQVDALANQTADPDEVFKIVEESAKPSGSMEEFYKFITDNMQYPPEAKAKGVSGRVFIGFVVEKDGTLSDLRVLKGIGFGCDEEALNALSKCPPWQPATQRGKFVRQMLVLPIVFNSDKVSIEGGVIPNNKKMKIKVGSIDIEDGKASVRGQVFDENTNSLPGINIVIQGTTQGTVSDQYGNFEITLTEESQMLVFSFVGYQTQTLGVWNRYTPTNEK